MAPDTGGWFFANGGFDFNFWNKSFAKSTSFMYWTRMSVNFFIISVLMASLLRMFLNRSNMSNAPSDDLQTNARHLFFKLIFALRSDQHIPQFLEWLINKDFRFVFDFRNFSVKLFEYFLPWLIVFDGEYVKWDLKSNESYRIVQLKVGRGRYYNQVQVQTIFMRIIRFLTRPSTSSMRLYSPVTALSSGPNIL